MWRVSKSMDKTDQFIMFNFHRLQHSIVCSEQTFPFLQSISGYLLLSYMYSETIHKDTNNCFTIPFCHRTQAKVEEEDVEGTCAVRLLLLIHSFVVVCFWVFEDSLRRYPFSCCTHKYCGLYVIFCSRMWMVRWYSNHLLTR